MVLSVELVCPCYTFDFRFCFILKTLVAIATRFFVKVKSEHGSTTVLAVFVYESNLQS